MNNCRHASPRDFEAYRRNKGRTFTLGLFTALLGEPVTKELKTSPCLGWEIVDWTYEVIRPPKVCLLKELTVQFKVWEVGCIFMLRYFTGVSRELCVNIVINFLRIIRTRVINLIWTYKLHINTTLALSVCDLHIPANECGSLWKVSHLYYLYSNYRTCVGKKYIHKHLCFSLVSCFEIKTK